MKVLFLTSGRQVPSSRFRVLQYVPYLRALGHHCHVAASFPPKYEHLGWLGWRGSTWLRRSLRVADGLRSRLGGYDVVYLERGLFHDASLWGERMIRRMSRRLVFDFDDAIFQEHPEKFAQVVPCCNSVIAGNELLAERARELNPRTVVIPTCVDLRHYPQRTASDETPTIGWIGTSSNLKYLEIASQPLRQLATERQFRLRVVCDRPKLVADLPLTGVNVEPVRWSESAEIAELAKFDVGLMPLADDGWTRYKCGLKAIQYLAIGIPAVVSPIGVNREIVQPDATGYWATTPDEWHAALSRLLDDAHRRARLGTAGRATVAARYSIESQLPRFLAALEEAAV
jgi:glycosyltransferase involved in cell wall biosynthesis